MGRLWAVWFVFESDWQHSSTGRGWIGRDRAPRQVHTRSLNAANYISWLFPVTGRATKSNLLKAACSPFHFARRARFDRVHSLRRARDLLGNRATASGNSVRLRFFGRSNGGHTQIAHRLARWRTGGLKGFLPALERSVSGGGLPCEYWYNSLCITFYFITFIGSRSYAQHWLL